MSHDQAPVRMRVVGGKSPATKTAQAELERRGVTMNVANRAVAPGAPAAQAPAARAGGLSLIAVALFLLASAIGGVVVAMLVRG